MCVRQNIQNVVVIANKVNVIIKKVDVIVDKVVVIANKVVVIVDKVNVFLTVFVHQVPLVPLVTQDQLG